MSVGIVHAGGEIRFVAVARDRPALEDRLGEHVRRWCRYQLAAEDAEAVERALDGGRPGDALRRYFERPGRWEPERLVIEDVALV